MNRQVPSKKSTVLARLHEAVAYARDQETRLQSDDDSYLTLLADGTEAYLRTIPPLVECKNCRYFADESDNEGEYGDCHRRAPQPIIFAQVTDERLNQDGSVYTMWPSVRGHDWCGEFQSKASREAAWQRPR